MRNPNSKRNQTTHIIIDLSLCKACGKCIEICPNEVLGMIAILWHRHVRVNRNGICKGCKKCIKACENNAIQPQVQILKTV